METLNSENIDGFNAQKSLIRIMDVVNFEGPLLTLFENTKNNYLYLFDWVDRDNHYNRWLVYRCKPNVISKFIKSEISHYELFIADQTYCYSIDIEKNLNWKNIQLIEKKHLPESYFPQKDVFFEESDCPNFPKLHRLVIQFQANQKQENTFVPSYTTKVYSNTNLGKKFNLRAINNQISTLADKVKYSFEANPINTSKAKLLANREIRKEIGTKKYNSYV